MDEQRTDSGRKEDRSKRRLLTVVGYSLLVVSTIAWVVSLFVVPFLPWEAQARVAVGGTMFIFAEVTFYGAIPFLGREIVSLVKNKLNPFKWFGKNRRSPSRQRAQEKSQTSGMPPVLSSGADATA
jgi:hypothetical protein